MNDISEGTQLHRASGLNRADFWLAIKLMAYAIHPAGRLSVVQDPAGYRNVNAKPAAISAQPEGRSFAARLPAVFG
ncbi:MAG: hypothetical protein ACYDD1_00620 [Caulobacteraceae bacterium]